MNKKEEKEKKGTPIIDGDARPDMPVDPSEIKSKLKKKTSGEGKFTSGRISDVNSIEDHKDAR